ncbi:Hypothetical_protein [Hexamita inflata]|uniref:Hypothetical_protein n=1 Tax=Hexamita inflata TaxID=28002 RepID=A0ABP1HHT5_9EUKA
MDESYLHNLRFQIYHQFPSLDINTLIKFQNQLILSCLPSGKKFTVVYDSVLNNLVHQQRLATSQLIYDQNNLFKSTLLQQDLIHKKQSQLESLSSDLQQFRNQLLKRSKLSQQELISSHADTYHTHSTQLRSQLTSLNQQISHLSSTLSNEKQFKQCLLQNLNLVQKEAEIQNLRTDFNNFLGEKTNQIHELKNAFQILEEKKNVLLLNKTKLKSELQKQRDKNKNIRTINGINLRDIIEQQEIISEQMEEEYQTWLKIEESNKNRPEDERVDTVKDAEIIQQKYEAKLQDIKILVNEAEKQYKIRKITFTETENKVNFALNNQDDKTYQKQVNWAYDQLSVLKNTVKHQERQIKYLESMIHGDISIPVRISITEAYE